MSTRPSVHKVSSRDLAAPTPTEAAAIEAVIAAPPDPPPLVEAVREAIGELRDFERDAAYLMTATHQRTRVEVARDTLERALRAGGRS